MRLINEEKMTEMIEEMDSYTFSNQFREDITFNHFCKNKIEEKLKQDYQQIMIDFKVN